MASTPTSVAAVSISFFRSVEMDADGAGKVSKTLFLANGVKRFEEADADKNGKLSFEEFREYHWNG